MNFEPTNPSSSGERWLGCAEIPTAEELNPDWDTAYDEILRRLKHNDVTTPYTSKEEYLETHYRLQREEGITNLRFSVKTFRENPYMCDDESTCVYTKVRSPTASKHFVAILVKPRWGVSIYSTIRGFQLTHVASRCLCRAIR